MHLTVGALLGQPGLNLELRVPGQLERHVRWVQVSELIATSPPYLRGGDVILNEDRWQHDPHPEAYIRSLVAADAAAFGCGLRAGGDDVSDALVDACAAANLTLFVVPSATPFVAVIERFVELLRKDSEAQLLETIDRSTRLAKALGRPGTNVGTHLLSILRDDLGVDVWLVDHTGRLIAAHGNERTLSADALVGRPTTQIPTLAHALGLEAVPVGGTSARTWLLVATRATTDADTIITQTVPFLASALARDWAELEAERRYASELIDLILDGQERLAAVRLEALGYEVDRPMLAVVLSGSSRQDVLAYVRRAAEQLRLYAVVALQDDTVTMVVQDRMARRPELLAEELHTLLGGDWVIGVGNPSTDVRGLRRSIIQAREAGVLASTRRAGHTWAAADSLSTHRVLLELKDPVVLASFADSLIGPILRHDEERSSQLVHTLTTFLEENGQYNQTASKLHVHVNTLRQRLARCEELTNRSLSRMEDRVDLFLALRAITAQAKPLPDRVD